MILFIASVVGGLTLGTTYALMGLGLVLVFRATTTFNFAHGEMMLLPAFIVGALQGGGSRVGLGLILALVVAVVVGAAFYLAVLRRTTGLPLFMGVIATFGLAAVLDGVMGIFFRQSQYYIKLPGFPTGQVTIGGARINELSLVLTGGTLVLSAIIVVIVRFTHIGTTLRAAGQDAVLASQCGIRVRSIYTASWAIASVLAAVAGIAYGTGAVVSTSMLTLSLSAMPAIVLGGMDSIEGAVLGGVLIGLLQGFVQSYLGGDYVNLITYVLLLLTLLFYPQGMFGTKIVVRA